jgi:hypothetical protein
VFYISFSYRQLINNPLNSVIMDVDERNERRINIAVIESSDLPPEYPGLLATPGYASDQSPKPPPYSDLFGDPLYADVFSPPPPYAAVTGEPGTGSGRDRVRDYIAGALPGASVQYTSRSHQPEVQILFDPTSQRHVPTILQPNHHLANRRTRQRRTSHDGQWCFCLDILFVTILFLTNCPLFVVVSLLRSEWHHLVLKTPLYTLTSVFV